MAYQAFSASPAHILPQSLCLILTALALSACAPKTWRLSHDAQIALSSEKPCGFAQNSEGQRLSWKQKVPVHVYLSNDFPDEFIPAVKAAAEKWNDSLNRTLFIVEEQKLTSQNVKNMIDWITTSGMKSTDQGVTKIQYSKNRIYQATMKINAKSFHFYMDEPDGSADVHLESLMIHELGHLLGLKHSDQLPTVMWPSLRGSTKRIDLSDNDVSSTRCEY